MTKHYVVCMRPELEPGDVKIVGPFENAAAAGAYGDRWQAENSDHPCWQALTLPDDFAPTITAP